MSITLKRKLKFSDASYHKASYLEDLCHMALHEIEQLEARVKELMGLVEAAYKEGYFDGAGDYPYCEWDVSDSKNQLDELKAGE